MFTNCCECGEPTFDWVESEDTVYGVRCEGCAQRWNEAEDMLEAYP